MTRQTSDIITPETDPGHHTVGHVFHGWDGGLYFCDSYDPSCGYWMTDIGAPANRRNVSERAVGRTYHERPEYHAQPGAVYEVEGVGRVTVDHLGHNGLMNGSVPSAIYLLPGSTCSWGVTTLADWRRVARLVADPRDDVDPHPVRALRDAIHILAPRHKGAAYRLGLQLRVAYSSAERAAQSGPLFDSIDPAALGCQCPTNGHGCLCGHDELVLRAYARGVPGLPLMTLAQREAVIADAVADAEGALQRADLEHLTDQALADERMGAMWDYVRSQMG
jgi:hypothetical protein